MRSRCSGSDLRDLVPAYVNNPGQAGFYDTSRRVSRFMSLMSNRISAQQLFSISSDGHHYELIEGELRMMSPAGNRHGRIAMRLGSSLELHVRKQELGAVFAAETGFLIATDPDTVRAPDVAFVRKEAFERHAGVDGYLPLAPDLVAEVLSPRDAPADVEQKISDWLTAGSAVVLVVDPGKQIVTQHRSKGVAEVLRARQTLAIEDIVPVWQLPIAELFAE